MRTKKERQARVEKDHGSRVGCIVLAAGRSTRMGANKLVADVGGRPLITHVADAIERAGLPAPIMVLGHDPGAIRAALGNRDVRFVMAHDHDEGMARSLAAGIAAVPPDWVAAIVCLGDMPMLSSALLRKMAAGATEASIIVPMFEGHRGNPLLWGRAYFPELTAFAGDRGGRALLATYRDRITPIEWTDEGIRIDVDAPVDLDLVRSRMRDDR